MINSRRIYIYLKGNHSQDLINFILEYDEDIEVNHYRDNVLLLKTDSDSYGEIIDSAREFSLVELYQDFTVFIAPKEFDFHIDELLKILPLLSPKIYTMELLIPEIIFLEEHDLTLKLKNHYYSKFNSETIETILGFIEQNMNASKTSKSLYMHRNTLNYRLDNFIQKTEIDVRTFKGALAIYLLFRR